MEKPGNATIKKGRQNIPSRNTWPFRFGMNWRSFVFVICFITSVGWVSYGAYVRYYNDTFSWKIWTLDVYKSWITDFEYVHGARSYAIAMLGYMPENPHEQESYFVIKPTDLAIYFSPALLLFLLGLRSMVFRRISELEFRLFAYITVLLILRIILDPYIGMKD
jgi:hypothetical protein